MIIQTTRFGDLELEEQEVIDFPLGIPGFQHLRKYTIISLPEGSFYYIQSVDEGSLAFVAVSPFDFYPGYEFKLPEGVQKDLGSPSIEDIRVLNIVTIKDDLQQASVNLVAPIVWNAANRLAVQVILQDTGYRTRHPLLSRENQTSVPKEEL